MLTRLYMYWRALGTGFCFLSYGTLSLLCSLTVLPAIVIWPGDDAVRERRIRTLVSWSFRTLLGTIAGLGLGRVEVEGREWLAQAGGKLIVATHPMYLDVVAMIGLLPSADCVVKSAMLSNPFYRRFARAAGYISNGDPATLVDLCVDSLQRGRSLLLFPEGTRQEPGKPWYFKRGAAQVAIRSNCEILPVMIDCSPPALLKSTSWYQVPDRPWRLRIKVFPPQPLTAFGHRDDLPYGVAARHLTRNLEDFFKQQLANHEHTDRRTEAAHHRLARS